MTPATNHTSWTLAEIAFGRVQTLARLTRIHRAIILLYFTRFALVTVGTFTNDFAFGIDTSATITTTAVCACICHAIACVSTEASLATAFERRAAGLFTCASILTRS